MNQNPEVQHVKSLVTASELLHLIPSAFPEKDTPSAIRHHNLMYTIYLDMLALHLRAPTPPNAKASHSVIPQRITTITK